ncbi:hypothetical protein HDU99_008470, partial [Rhizoclosmatium hyalinum]
PTSPSTPSSQSKSNATHSHVSQSPLHGIKPALVYQLYSTVSSKSPSLLNALTQSHWDSLAQHTLLAFLPTDPSTCPTIPQFLPPMLTSCYTRIITDMKLRNVPFTATTFAALYKSHIGDPRKAIAIHEIARAQMDAKSCLVPVISDESIQTLIGVLLYGGNSIRSPEVHIQRSGPILAYRTTSSGTKPTLVDIASVMEDLWQDLETYKIRASRATLLAFVEAFGSFKEKNWVERVHRWMTPGGGKTKRGPEFTIVVYRAFMVAHGHSLLKTNLRCLAALNRFETLLHTFPRVTEHHKIHPTDETIQLLLNSLVKIAPPSKITTPYLTSVNEFITQALDLSSQSHRLIIIASYVSLITSSCKLSFLPLAYTSYNDMKGTILLRNAHTTALKTFTSRTAVASILETESANPTTSSFETAMSFFRTEMFPNGSNNKTDESATRPNLLNFPKPQKLVSDISALESKIAAALDAGFRKGLELRISEQGIEEGILEAEERELVQMACEMDDGGVLKVSFDIDIKSMFTMISSLKSLLLSGTSIDSTSPCEDAHSNHAELTSSLDPALVALIHKAVEIEDIELIHKLAQQLGHGQVDVYDDDGWTPLHHAAYSGSTEAVNVLLNYGADVNARDKWKRAPLHFACNHSIALLLLNHGAAPNALDSYNRSPLCYAISFSREVDLVCLLLERGANVEQMGDNETPLFRASQNNLFDHACWLISFKANLNTVCKGKSPLSIAAECGHSDMVKLLLANGANPNQFEFCQSPLYLAIKACHNDVANFLLEFGNSRQFQGNVNTVHNDQSLLSIAAECGNLNLIKALVEIGANVNQFEYEKSPLFGNPEEPYGNSKVSDSEKRLHFCHRLKNERISN